MRNDEPTSIQGYFMGSFASVFVFIFAGLFLLPANAACVEVENAEYRHTILTLENLDTQSITATFRQEVKQNDHTASVLSDSKQRNLYIIHHKSLGVKDIEAIITAHPGMTIKAVAQHNYQPANKYLLSNYPDNLRVIRNCGATKAA